jgi:CheY-like chemotaxis protein
MAGSWDGGSVAQVEQLSVFVVEDETLIRMMLVDMVEELGHRVVAEAGSIKDAQTLAEAALFDIAILDVNVGDGRIDPVAGILDGRNLPFLFATGYASSNLPANFSDRQHLQKPYSLDKLRQAIELALGERAGRAPS